VYTYDAFGRIVQQQHIRPTVEPLSQRFIAPPNTQTFSLVDPSSQLITQSSTLTFAHDGHGSVRVLFGAAAAIAQVFTYSAYGDLLAIHNGSGLLTPNTSALTAYLYNGEGVDARTGLYNMRARWYSASNARWERLDPFEGNPTDPFSFNKYGFVHGDPVMGTDPTGMFFGGIGGMLASIAIGGNLQSQKAFNDFDVYFNVHAETDKSVAMIKRYVDIARLLVLSGAGTFGLLGVLKDFGLLTRTAKALQGMIDNPATARIGKMIADWFSKASFITGASDLASLSDEMFDLFQMVSSLRRGVPNGKGNIAAVHYEVLDIATNTWRRQQPIVRFNDSPLHSEGVLIDAIDNMHPGQQTRITHIFSERVPCVEGCSAAIVTRQAQQGTPIEMASFTIETGKGAPEFLKRIWKDIWENLL
jgi:RHS repeat-associated protein